MKRKINLSRNLRLLTFASSVVALAVHASVLAASARSDLATTRVQIDSGAIVGRAAESNPQLLEFLGIPYAAAPTAENRWRPPRPAAAWRSVRQTIEYGPACPQLPSAWLPEMLGKERMQTDEDCLYLNVWTTKLHARPPQAVMVWIHGGGNIEGSQEWPPLGRVLAARGVVVVTLNYRLGVFGYFSHPALTAESSHRSSGNYGLLDQIAALQWVRRNIAQFGGDPHRVTVFGASSGSLDVCDLMASPLAAGLFHAAILQSGVCVDGVAPTLAHQESDGIRLAKDLGIEQGPDDLARLRDIPADELLHKAAKEDFYDFNPVVDRWVLIDQPAITFREARQNKVPVIVGSNKDEITVFASPLVNGKAYRPATMADYRQWLRKSFAQNADAVFAAYPALNDGEVPAAFHELDTDYEFGFGSWLLAQEVARSGQDVFLYNFTYVSGGPLASLGAFHSEESILLSKKYWRSWVHRPEDEVLSDALITYWTQFAKTLNPNGGNLPNWPAYSSRSEVSQELGTRVGEIRVWDLDRFAVFQKILDEQLKTISNP